MLRQDDETDERLAVREQVALAKLGNLPRSYRDLPGVPPVPPSDMDPAFRVFVEKRKASVEKSLKVVHEDRKSTRLNSSHSAKSRMPSSA